MCSWCWGISPQLNALHRYSQEKASPFSLVMGGLRAGGGDVWNTKFKNFLKHHWEEVAKRSGQPFSDALLNQDDFNYDTEPACRAIVTVRNLSPHKVLRFYELFQHSFYVESNDPKELVFYEPICKKLGIDFTNFSQKFISQEMKEATQKDFAKSRSIGASGFPSVIYRKKDTIQFITRGYATYESMKASLEAMD